jgi:uncharacterized protein (TIGR02266 family)
MDSDAYHERRRHPRVPTSLPVRVSTIEPERDPWTGRPFFRASRETCANVSRGGVYVRTGEPLTPGRRVLLELELPGGRPLEAIGRVAWQRRVMTPPGGEGECGVGVEFLGAASDQISALEDFIESFCDRADATDPDA